MADSRVAADISNAFGKLQADYYGRGPLKARTYMTEDLVVVALEETFTAAEKTLIAHGEAAPVQQIRRTFQQAMRDQFSSIIEQATGRRVRAFVSETDIEADVSVEVFLLADARTDMSGYESPGSEGE
jgi:uncharacterized protein YbcI